MFHCVAAMSTQWGGQRSPPSQQRTPCDAHLYFDGTAANGSDSFAYKVHIHLCGVLLQLRQHLEQHRQGQHYIYLCGVLEQHRQGEWHIYLCQQFLGSNMCCSATCVADDEV